MEPEAENNGPSVPTYWQKTTKPTQEGGSYSGWKELVSLDYANHTQTASRGSRCRLTRLPVSSTPADPRPSVAERLASREPLEGGRPRPLRARLTDYTDVLAPPGDGGPRSPGTMCGHQVPMVASPSSKEPAPGGCCTAAYLQGPSNDMSACLSPLPTGSARTPLRYPLACLSYMPPRPPGLELVGHSLGVGDRSSLPHVGGGAPSR
jgi:hypothetical protein